MKIRFFHYVLALALLTTSSCFAYCARCVAIEKARSEEQAAHPQEVGYYDEQTSKKQIVETADSTKVTTAKD